jgi:Domain of unknown function (DUF4113)
MKSAVLSHPQPVFIPEKKVWLEVCGWKVPAGFASPAADHKEWQMRQERKSPNYTTAWDEVPVV